MLCGVTGSLSELLRTADLLDCNKMQLAPRMNIIECSWCLLSKTYLGGNFMPFAMKTSPYTYATSVIEKEI